MPGDRRRAGAVEPEFLARLGRDRDKAFGAARIADAHDFGGRARDRVIAVADDVADQDHLRPAMTLRLGRVADRLDVALVQVLEPGELHALAWRSTGEGVDITLDLDDRRR